MLKKLLLCFCLLSLQQFAWGDTQVAAAPGKPAWILNPAKPGYTSAVGYAPKQSWGGRDAQYRFAMLKARQELAQTLQVNIEATNQSETETRDGAATQSATSDAELQSNVALRLEAAKVQAEWTDPQSGTLYLWLVTPE